MDELLVGLLLAPELEFDGAASDLNFSVDMIAF
jgi:hypothetical protein